MTAVIENTDAPLLRFTQRAMATEFEIVFPWGTVHADRVAAAAFELIEQLESQLSVFRETSEVSRLNRIAHQAAIPVDRELFRLLQRCEQLTLQTGGAFDITSGPLTKAWGFFARQGRLPSETERDSALACVGIRKMELDEERSSVRFTRPGVEINLGSIGKGYALDRVSEVLQMNFGIQNALLHAGTSSVLAIGDKSWPVGVKHPHETRRLGTIRLRNRAMATSGATNQYFDYNGRKFGHLLDPRNGSPAEGIALAMTLAPTAAEADALATAFYVLGAVETEAYCCHHPEIAAVLVANQADAGPVSINTADEWLLGRGSEVYSIPEYEDC